MSDEPASKEEDSAAAHQQPSADLLLFKPRTVQGSYDPAAIQTLRDLVRVPKRSDVTWLGECDVPRAVLQQLSDLLDTHPELRAMKIRDQNGGEMTLWTGDLPNGYGY